MSVRQRREILDKLCKQFQESNLKPSITYSGYIGTVKDPVLPRAIRKTYGNWSRAVKAVQLAKPEIFAPKPAPAPKAALKPEVEAPKTFTASPKVEKPSAKPVETKTVSVGKEEDGKDI